jgi:hypothetical protein
MQKIYKNTNKKADIRLLLDKALLEKVRIEAIRDKRTMVNFVTKLIIEYFEQKELNPK